MSHYKLALLGFGNVGQALARLLMEKQQDIKQRYDITYRITGIATSRHGMALNPDGLDFTKAIELMKIGHSLREISARPASESVLDFIRVCGAHVLFENTPVDYATGQPAIDHLRAALQIGMHAITANKGAVVHGFRQLSEEAAKRGRKFYFESTVMDGAPIFSLFREALPAASLKSFSGILNSTTNLILTRMEDGETFEQAVTYAQSIGIAETDPSGDIDGWDAAIKVCALATVLMGIPLKPDQVECTGIRQITPAEIASAKAAGKRWKLVCSARRTGNELQASVAPRMVGSDSPLFGVTGTSSAVQFESDVLGPLSIIETDPGPATTAYGLLADFINAVRN
jgi:homoserine dehydrogenase